MAWVRCEGGALLNAALLEYVDKDGFNRDWRVWAMHSGGKRAVIAERLEESQAVRVLEFLADSLPVHASLSGMVDVRSLVANMKSEPITLAGAR
jgi:hypothetical protein